jgi:hypothetical protein
MDQRRFSRNLARAVAVIALGAGFAIGVFGLTSSADDEVSWLRPPVGLHRVAIEPTGSATSVPGPVDGGTFTALEVVWL